MFSVIIRVVLFASLIKFLIEEIRADEMEDFIRDFENDLQYEAEPEKIITTTSTSLLTTASSIHPTLHTQNVHPLASPR